jgi:membrane protein
MASSITVAVSGQITTIINRFEVLQTIGPAVFTLLKVLPYCVIWLLFTFIYVFMPNTQVKFKAALTAGIVAGTIYQIIQFCYITFQVGAGQYNAIYGSFAALPLFLFWLQLSWLAVLFGAEISFALQNVATYEFEPDCNKISLSLKRLLSLNIVHLLVKRFEQGEAPVDHESIAHELDLPIRLVNQILYDLSSCGLISETVSKDGESTGFQPALNTDQITIHHVISRLERDGSTHIPLVASDDLDKIKGHLNAFADITESSSSNIKLKDL